MAQVTRLGTMATPAKLYGAFSGKLGLTVTTTHPECMGIVQKISEDMTIVQSAKFCPVIRQKVSEDMEPL